MWAQIAGGGAAAPKQEIVTTSEAKSTCVVDANAIIAGIRVENLGERIATVPEVRSSEPPVFTTLRSIPVHFPPLSVVQKARYGRASPKPDAGAPDGYPAAQQPPP